MDDSTVANTFQSLKDSFKFVHITQAQVETILRRKKQQRNDGPSTKKVKTENVETVGEWDSGTVDSILSGLLTQMASRMCEITVEQFKLQLIAFAALKNSTSHMYLEAMLRSVTSQVGDEGSQVGQNADSQGVNEDFVKETFNIAANMLHINIKLRKDNLEREFGRSEDGEYFHLEYNKNKYVADDAVTVTRKCNYTFYEKDQLDDEQRRLLNVLEGKNISQFTKAELVQPAIPVESFTESVQPAIPVESFTESGQQDEEMKRIQRTQFLLESITSYEKYLSDVHEHDRNFTSTVKMSKLKDLFKSDAETIKGHLRENKSFDSYEAVGKDIFIKSREMLKSAENVEFCCEPLLILRYLTMINLTANDLFFGQCTGALKLGQKVLVIDSEYNEDSNGKSIVHNVSVAGMQASDALLKDDKREIVWHTNTKTLKKEIEGFRCSSDKVILLFSGDPGCGKTSVAWYMANKFRRLGTVLWATYGEGSVNVAVLPKSVDDAKAKPIYQCQNIAEETAEAEIFETLLSSVAFFDAVKGNKKIATYGSEYARRYAFSSMSSVHVRGSKQSQNASSVAKGTVIAIPEKEQKDIVKQNTDIQLRFLWTLPQSRLWEYLIKLHSKTLDFGLVLDELLKFKQYYSGRCFRWLLNDSVPSIIEQVHLSSSKVGNIDDLANLLSGAASKDAVNTLFSSTTTSTVLVSSYVKYAIYRRLSNADSVVRNAAAVQKLMGDMPDNSCKGGVAENYIWSTLSNGTLELCKKGKCDATELEAIGDEAHLLQITPNCFQIKKLEDALEKETSTIKELASSESFLVQSYTNNPGWDYAIVDKKACHFLEMTISPTHSLNLSVLTNFLRQVNAARPASMKITRVNFSFLHTNDTPLRCYPKILSQGLQHYTYDGVNNWPSAHYLRSKKKDETDQDQISLIHQYQVKVPGINSFS